MARERAWWEHHSNEKDRRMWEEGIQREKRRGKNRNRETGGKNARLGTMPKAARLGAMKCQLRLKRPVYKRLSSLPEDGAKIPSWREQE